MKLIDITKPGARWGLKATGFGEIAELSGGRHLGFFALCEHKQIYTREELSPKPFFDCSGQSCRIISAHKPSGEVRRKARYGKTVRRV